MSGKGSECNIVLQLTMAQLEKLNDVLYEHTDEGPVGHGWASDELNTLRELTTALIEAKSKA